MPRKILSVIYSCASCSKEFVKKAEGGTVEVSRLICCDDESEMAIKGYNFEQIKAKEPKVVKEEKEAKPKKTKKTK